MSKTDPQFIAQNENRRAESEDHERRIARLERLLAGWIARSIDPPDWEAWRELREDLCQLIDDVSQIRA